MADTIVWPAFDVSTVYHATVQLRPSWLSPWGEPIEGLHCSRCTWSASPGNSTAELKWRYGRGMLISSPDFETILRRVDATRAFVKIEVTTDVVLGHPISPVIWYGVIEIEADRLGGARIVTAPGGAKELVASGRQTFVCYGLESLLEMQYVTKSKWQHQLDEPQIVDRGLTFNADGRPNRSLLRGSNQAFIFSDNDDPDTGKYWSTREAVEYMLAEQSPVDWAGDHRIPFALDQLRAFMLPSWDRPVVSTHGRTVREVLNQLMPRQRLLSYYVTVDEVDGGTDRVVLRPFSFNDTEIVVAPGEALPANNSQKILAFEDDRTMQAAVKASSVDRIDYVEAVGAPRRNCCTISRADDTLDERWSPELETEYKVAASTADDYPADTEIEDRQRRNADTRKTDRLAGVYRRFGLPLEWDGLVGDGQGGPKAPAAPQDDDPDSPYAFYRPLLRVLSTLPILERHDYSGDKISKSNVAKVGPLPYVELRPLVLVPLPGESGKFQLIEKVGAASNLEDSNEGSMRSWSGHFVPIHRDAFELRVSGDQHMIAHGRFEPLDEDEPTGQYDYREFIITLAFEDPRQCRAQYPETLPFGFDALRPLRIDAGDAFRLDYVAPNTVVGLDPLTLEPIYSDEGGFVRDDREELKKACRVAYEWYRQTRKALQLSGSRITSALWLGDLVASIGNPNLPIPGAVHITDVRSCVTEISIDMPLGNNGPPPPRSVTWTTAFGELDPLGFSRTPKA